MCRTISIILLCICLGMGVFASCVSRELLTTKADKVLVEESRDQLLKTVTSNKTTLDEYLEEITALEEDVAESFQRADVLLALRDVGITSLRTVEEVREALEKTDDIPFGSPFAEGHYISSQWGYRDESKINGDGYTEGIDLVGKRGDRTVRTMADGEIIEFGYSATYGKYIVVEHPGGYRTKYSHLATIFYQNNKGDVKGVQIKKGDRIGIMGNTGVCFSTNGGDGSHLDLRIFAKDSDGIWKTLNPTEIIKYAGGVHKEDVL